MEVQRLFGIYHADSGLLGELSYLVGKLRGVPQCALCDITHQTLWTQTEWRRSVESVGLPFELLHLNEQSAEVEALSAGRTPCVLGESHGELRLLLGPEGVSRAR